MRSDTFQFLRMWITCSLNCDFSRDFEGSSHAHICVHSSLNSPNSYLSACSWISTSVIILNLVDERWRGGWHSLVTFAGTVDCWVASRRICSSNDFTLQNLCLKIQKNSKNFDLEIVRYQCVEVESNVFFEPPHIRFPNFALPQLVFLALLFLKGQYQFVRVWFL